MSDEEMINDINDYSKRWNVSPEEAKKKLQAFLEKKPTQSLDKSEDPTGLGSLLDDPASPYAKKVHGLNQALISIAYTKQKLKDLSTPPKEIEGLREKIESIEGSVGHAIEFMTTTAKEMRDELGTRKAEDERKERINDTREIVQPLMDKVEALEKLKKGEPGSEEAAAELTPEKIIEVGRKATEKAQAWLKKQGYDVKMPEALTMEQVEAKLKETVEEKKKEWEKESGATVEIETERIKATEKFLTTTTDRLFTIFLDPLKEEISKAIKARGFKRGPQ